MIKRISFSILAALSILIVIYEFKGLPKSTPARSYHYFVSYVAPVTNGNMEGWTVVRYDHAALTVEDLQATASWLRPNITNLSGNIIFKAFTPLDQ